MGLRSSTPQPSTYSQLLKEYWGYDDFRGIQEISSIALAKAKTPWG